MKEPFISIFGSLPPLKGISIYCWTICVALSQYVAVEVFSFKHLYPEWLYPGGTEDDDPGWDICESDTLRIRRSLTYYNPLSWLWCGCRAKARLIHFQWWSLPVGLVWIVVLAIVRLRGRRVVATIHNVEFHEKGYLDHLMRRMAFAMCHGFIVHCEDNRQQLAETTTIPLERIHVMPMPVLDQYCDASVTPHAARERIGLEPGRVAFLVFGNMRGYKGVDVFLRAVGRLSEEQRGRIKVLIVGQTWGDLADQYDRIIDELGLHDTVLKHYDYVPMQEVKYWFEASDVVVLPYRHFAAQSAVGSLVLAFGKPLLVTRVGGLPTLVKREEAIAEPDDVESLRAAIARLVDDGELRRQMAEDTQATAAQRSSDSSAKLAMDIYEVVLDEDFPPEQESA